MTQAESGFILATVIILTLILSVVILSFMSLSASQTISGQGVVDEIIAEQLAIGQFHRYHHNRFDNCSGCPTPGDCSSCQYNPISIPGGKTYTPSFVTTNTTVAPNDTDSVLTTVSY